MKDDLELDIIQVPDAFDGIEEFEKWLREVYIPLSFSEFTECWGLFSAQGQFIRLYQKFFISILSTEEDNEFRGKIISHNHITESTFSYDEILTCADLKMAEFRVVTESTTYTLKPRSSGWPPLTVIKEKIIELISPMSLIEFKMDSDARDKCYQSLSDYGIFEYHKYPIQ